MNSYPDDLIEFPTMILELTTKLGYLSHYYYCQSVAIDLPSHMVVNSRIDFGISRWQFKGILERFLVKYGVWHDLKRASWVDPRNIIERLQKNPALYFKLNKCKKIRLKNDLV